MVPESVPAAWFDGALGTGVADITHDPAALDGSGRWAVVVDFGGGLTAIRFDTWRRRAASELPIRWRGPQADDWASSLDHAAYCEAVDSIRESIARGDVYQANLCRVLSAPLPESASGHNPFALLRRILQGNPAPHAGAVHLPPDVRGRHVEACSVVTASPELYLRREGRTLLSRPIKGTAADPTGFLPKDRAENLMIVDLVRNDLAQVAETGSVTVPEFLRVEEHPGLAHLVSGVSATLGTDKGWAEILAATFPPGSVTGAPKAAALEIIGRLEPVDRGPYCGAVGWVDADRGTGVLAVGIRTFWVSGAPPEAILHFGTGAGITWGSDPQAEWRETELKAAKLVGLASGPSGRTA